MRGVGGLAIFAILLGLLFFRQAIGLYTDWLWFQEVGYTDIFITTLTSKTLLALGAGILLGLLLYISLNAAASPPSHFRYSAQDNAIELPPLELVDPWFRRLLLPGALLVAFMAGPQAVSHWREFLLFLNPSTFNLTDPQFGRDLGFYMFRLPMWISIYHWLMFGLGLCLIATAAVYLLYRGIEYGERGIFLSERARRHLLILLAALLAVKAGGYYLDAFELLYSDHGAAFGASYTDVHARLPALRLLAFLALAVSVLAVLQIYRAGYRPVLVGIAVLVVIHAVGLNVYPSLLQRFRVTPNEIAAERPFIERNIKFTREAFALDQVESREFPAEENLTAADLRRHQSTIDNIRLWDHRPLLATYSQLQEIRPYYKFVDVDNDRYVIDGTFRQTMLSARELSHQHLQSRNWINEHLTFTHGHGVVFGPVNQVTPVGLPEFFIKDIPPAATASLKIARPEIYFGELANEYILVQTQAQELDYPSGDQNVYTKYEGRGGVSIGSLWRRLVFSAHHGTFRIVLSRDLTPASRILYHRRVQDRVRKIAPFINFDRDAYLVIAQNGQLFWIVDGYTTSDRFPYSAPLRRPGPNYMRNPVKAVVDAYHGTVDFYLSDPSDPIMQSYAKIFPHLVKPMDAMPEDLRSHVRYPQDFFSIQAHVYATYHVQDPQVFFNKEDILSVPRQRTDGREGDMEPYYTIMRLPGESKEEFVLLLPFTPSRRDNMRAWLAARSDEANYGKLMALEFPKAKLVYGPKQIDARIDQDTYISQQITLWSQAGSQVIRGSLLAIPIERSLLYVQPLYLAASQGSLPELKRVIVAFGSRIAMEETLEQSLQRLFDTKAPPPEAPSVASAAQPQPVADGKNLAGQALEHFRRAQDSLKQGNWTGYGDELKKVEALLRDMQKGP
jgi:uncharacterized membrane protein (UPF0182 family)